ncbi:hypothetical protein KIN20_007048 [Parelaphostrongylus tenuis]|uniref:Uncharacterized protein n=1 Tax=Parelaphostrongylus tenuis TaxID=148309 RepID=A0AAD5MLK4_PARTN|nr:hypothetical protein KIN20_007048 [Parelaphostrongylus tenuis]
MAASQRDAKSSNTSFTETIFKLPVSLVAYTRTGSIRIEVPDTARSKAAAKTILDRLVMQTINYDPLECKGATAVKDAKTMSKYPTLSNSPGNYTYNA